MVRLQGKRTPKLGDEGSTQHLRKRTFLRNEANKSFVMSKIIFA
jgi:hypothetical protein